ncbi:nuclear exosome regulator NRDE2, partial [Mantella aurantiaca]
MALFPAFAESAETGTADRDLAWLRNESFRTQDALSLHQRSLEAPPPSPISRSRPSPGSQSPASQEERSEVTRKKKKKKKHKEPKRRRGRSSDDSAPQTRSPDPPIREPPLPSPGSVWLEEAPPPAQVMFRIDKKADSANWEYKCLYRGDIARYRRRGGPCLGIDLRTQRIIWGDPPEKKMSAHKKPERYYSRGAVQALRMRAEPVECGVVAMDAATIGFIPVTDPSSNPGTSWLNPLGIYDQSTSMWLQGKGGPQEPSPPTPPRHPQIQAKVEEYNRKIRENPTHVQTWIDFLSFQDELLTEAGVGEMQGCRASLLEKKLCIVDRAIAGNAGSVALKLARLGICSELWEASALMKEWQKLIFLHPNDPQLWQKYLLFSQSHFTTFSVSRVHATYAKCLTTLSAIQDGSMTSHPALPGTERAMYEIFLQQCHFLRQAGQCEKSVSLYQAIIDFTFYQPESVTGMTTRGQVEFFEPFWDSAEPRFGENGAKGWSLWMRQQERGGWVSVHNLGEEEEEGEEDLDIKDKHLPHHEIWLDMERSRESRHWVPWRPDPDKKQTEEECEDPERQVLFDDLGSSMFRITIPALRFQLMLSFLQFLGVPCGPRPPPASLYLAMDEDSLFECTAANGRLVTTLQAPLAGVSRVGHLTVMSGGRRQIGHCKEGERFIQNVFQSALSLFHGEEKTQLCVCWLQYEVSKVARCFQAQRKKQLKSQGKRSKRLARSLLKEPLNRNSLALWAEFALLEWLLGNMEEARKVFDTAIGLAGGKGLKDGELCSLCLLYAELEGGIIDSLEGGGGSRAIHVLASLADSSPYKLYLGPVQAINILKAGKAYERALQDAMKLAPSPWLVALCGCWALFQYLTLGIDAAVNVFNEVAGSLPPPACEEGSHDSDAPLLAVTLMHIGLLRHHARVSVYPRAPLRDALSRAIRLFPDDVTLWRSYIQTESRCHQISRVRRFLDEMRRSGRFLETDLFTIHSEEKRNRLQEEIHRSHSGEELIFIPETGLSNRIKALYERAVATEHGRCCVLLWRMYLHFM